MLKLKSGDTVKKGFYASVKRWTIEMIETDGGALPGEAGERYMRLPVLAMLVVAPVMGAGLVMFLPLIGFVLLGVFGWRKLTAKRKFIWFARDRKSATRKVA